jgi:hypothetical protein
MGGPYSSVTHHGWGSRRSSNPEHEGSNPTRLARSGTSPCRTRSTAQPVEACADASVCSSITAQSLHTFNQHVEHNATFCRASTALETGNECLHRQGLRSQERTHPKTSSSAPAVTLASARFAALILECNSVGEKAAGLPAIVEAARPAADM